VQAACTRQAGLVLNVTNLFEEKGASTLSIGSATNGCSADPFRRGSDS
jgi:hypothetical protein